MLNENTKALLLKIYDIPADTTAVELPELLNPILFEISQLDPATASAILHYEIKNHFNFTTADIKAYEAMLRKLKPHVVDDTPKGERNETRNIVPGLLAWVKDSDGKTKYLLNTDNGIEIKETVQCDGLVCKPKSKTAEFMPTAVYSSDIIIKNIPYDPKKLLIDVEAFIKNHVELPEDKNYLIPALWVLHTYLVIERQGTSPIMVFHGLKESGKSRAAEVLAELAFRSFICTSLSETNMWHIPKAFDATMLIEELKLRGKNPKEDLESVMKTRYKKKTKVARMDSETKGNPIDRLQCYSTFGATCIATTERLGEFIDSRSIEFMMTKNERQEVENPINEPVAAELRERLLMFRHYWLTHELPAFAPVARQRKGEKFNPLFQMLIICGITPEKEKEFMDFMNETENEKKSAEFESKHASILIKILSLTDMPWIDFKFKISDLLTKLNEGVSHTDPTYNKRKWISEQLHLMNFKKEKSENRHHIATFKNIKSLCQRFDIPVPKAPEMGSDIPF